jgi:dTDP-4-amino-4,6-dideoxygalactose transaminase
LEELLRSEFLSYCLPSIGDDEVREVVDSLRSGWITTGPKVKRFEADFANYVGARHAIAVSSCTAALHLALASLDIGPGDEVIVPTLTFCATANVVVHVGARPVVVDVREDFQIDPQAVERAITPRTRAIVPIHYGGQACDLEEILAIGERHGVPVIEDAAHAVGAAYRGRKIGTHSLMVAFSFYATKNMTTGEGGMLVTNDDGLAERIRLLSLHGMNRDAWKRYTEAGSWFYEVSEPGFKNNMTDIQAALGIHQLRRLDGFIERRQAIARSYRAAFADLPELRLPVENADRSHIYHLYAVQILPGNSSLDRDSFIAGLKSQKIGTSVHFVPLHRHPYYRDTHGCRSGAYPVAERLYRGLVSLPLYPAMSDQDVEDVIGAVRETVLAARLASTEFVLAEKAPSAAFRAPSAGEGKDSALRTNYDYNHA